MNEAVIVFSGFNQRAVVAFLRTLDAADVPYAIIAASAQDPIHSTAYASQVAAVRKQKQLVLEDILETVTVARQKLGADCLIAPSTEALNRFLLQHTEALQQTGCEVPLVNTALYKSISDKYAFQALCQQSDIVVPQEYDSVERVKLPYAAKPKTYQNGKGETHAPVLVQGPDEHQSFVEHHDVGDFYFQEFVGGDSLYLLYYFYKDGDVVRFSQRNLVQQPGGKSIIAAQADDFHHSAEADQYEKLLAGIGYFGLVMVEVKRFNGKCYMIEANPRFWGPSQLFVDANVNLFLAFLYDNGVLSAKPAYTDEQATDARYFWSGGMAAAIGTNEKVALHGASSNQVIADLSTWMSSDVYNRDDTREIFKQETKVWP